MASDSHLIHYIPSTFDRSYPNAQPPWWCQAQAQAVLGLLGFFSNYWNTSHDYFISHHLLQHHRSWICTVWVDQYFSKRELCQSNCFNCKLHLVVNSIQCGNPFVLQTVLRVCHEEVLGEWSSRRQCDAYTKPPRYRYCCCLTTISVSRLWTSQPAGLWSASCLSAIRPAAVWSARCLLATRPVGLWSASCLSATRPAAVRSARC